MMPHTLKFICTLIVVWGFTTGVLSPVLHAQEVEVIPLDKNLIRLSYWKESNTLPTWHINEIIRDQRGLVWLGMETGLYLLDGKRFRQHQLDILANPTPEIRRIVIDRHQNLWLFYPGSNGFLDIVIYDPYREQSFTLEMYTGVSLKISALASQSIFERDGDIWIGDYATGQAGYFDQHKKWHESARFVPIQDTNPRAVLPANDSTVWIFERPSGRLTLLNRTGQPLAQYTAPSTLSILDYKIGSDDQLYLYFKDTRLSNEAKPVLFRCSPAVGLIPVPSSEMVRIKWRKLSFNGYRLPPILANNQDGIHIIKAYNNNIKVFDNDTLIYDGLERHFVKKEISSIQFRLVALEDGSFWMIGVGALIRIEVARNYFNLHFQDLALPASIRGMVRYQNQLFANSYTGLLAQDLLTRQTKRISGESGRSLAIYHNDLWSSMHSYVLLQRTLPDMTPTNYPINAPGYTGESEAIYIAKNGRVYWGSFYNSFSKAPEAKTFEPLEGVKGITFHENKAGLWAAGPRGIWLLDSLQRVERVFADEITYKGERPFINHIHEDADGIFWMATNSGLWRWKPFTNEVEVFNQKNHGLLNNKLHAVYEDQHGRLWIPSDKGLVCFNKQHKTFFTFTHLNGLPSNEFNHLSHYQDNSGRLYFGGISGAISFDPNRLEELPSYSPNIQLLSFKITSKRNNLAGNILTHEAIFSEEPIQIPDGTEMIEINYCVPTFLKEPIRYRWRIPQLDSTWHYLSEPTFSVYHLPYGQYTLELGITCPGNSGHHESSLILPLQVERPFYLKPWFIGLGILSLSGLIMLVFHWRQQNLRNLSRTLAAEVAEKTAQLKHERDIIAQQKEALLEQNEEKNRFFQYLGHEFRNPLTLILSPVNDLIKHPELPYVYKPKLEQIKRNANKILHLIEEVLELSKLEAGAIAVNMTDIPLAIFIDRICRDFESAAVQKSISLQLTQDLPPDLRVLTDGRKLEKIMINLIQNALKYTPSPGEVRVKAQWLPQGVLDVWVSDTGIGISPEYIGQIFDRYFQVPAGNRHGSQTGFGIGLSLCRHYASLLGGNLTVFSKVGEGTDMHVTIPCARVPGSMETPKRQPAPPANVSLQHKRLLIVDDQPEMVSYLADFFEAEYQLIRAYSAAEALDVLSTMPVDLVISDFMMAEMNGLELLRCIRQDSLFGQVSFVLLTGLNSAHFEEEVKELHVSGIFSKPVDQANFTEAIRQILRDTPIRTSHHDSPY